MKLVWKLLRQHISWPQFVGFFFANLFGMTIVLLGYQLYCDILPIFTANDSFLKADYLVVSKQTPWDSSNIQASLKTKYPPFKPNHSLKGLANSPLRLIKQKLRWV